MKRGKLLIFVVALIILCFTNTSFAWQGRMSGMVDPFGLISDESDLFIHPARITDGAGSNYYFDYKFNYVQVTKWNNIFSYSPAVQGSIQYPFMATGSERDHDVSLGGTWMFGPGRLGLFVQYATKDGSFSGTDNNGIVIVNNDTFSFDTDRRSFDVKLLYGVPVGSWKLGAELAVGHRTLTNSTTQNIQNIGTTLTILNNPIGARNPFYNTFPFMVPIDWRWKEASLRVSAEHALGPGVLTFTPRYATLFDGTSEYNNRFLFGTLALDDIHNRGSLKGWSGGADIWYRVKLNDSMTLPFVASLNYDRIRAENPAFDTAALQPVQLSSEAKKFVLEVGGGIDSNISKETKIASGLYYNYIQSKTMFMYDYTNESNYTVANNETPLEREHRIILKTAVEHLLSSAFTMRGGINAFYGKVRDHFGFINTQAGVSLESQDIKTSGHRWGLNAAAGATVLVSNLSIEPFLTAGLQKTRMDHSSGSFFPPESSVSLQSDKSEWTVGGGVSIKY